MNVRVSVFLVCLILGNRVVAGQPDLVSFRLEVVPVFAKLGCSQGTCHGSQKGKGGFKLSLRGDDPAYDALSIARDALGRRVRRDDPAASLLVLKPSGQVPHEGGKLFEPNSVTNKSLIRWIGESCADDSNASPRIVSLTVDPVERMLAGNQPRRQPLKVTAKLSDGSNRDVTRLAVYEVSEPSRVQVTADGVVTAREPLEVAVAIRYAGARTTSRIAFLADRPNFVWRPIEPISAFDRSVFEKLRAVRVQPSELTDDSTFLRRAYLAAIGKLPSVDASRKFLADKTPNKRGSLAAALVERPEFAEFWALKWADILRNEEKVMGPKGVQLFHDWLVAQIRADVPMDVFAKSLLATIGSTWEHPPASFHRTNREPAVAAEAAAQVFLGYRLQCAKCHNHPFDVWTQDDYYGLAAYFARVERKPVGEDQRKDKNDKHELNGDEIISLKASADFRHPIRNVVWNPKPLGARIGQIADLSKFPSKTEHGRKPKLDPLTDLANGLTADPQFPRNLANRTWYHLFGRGVVDPPDDFRESNPPSNPALLDSLTKELVSSRLRLKKLVSAILASRTFQLSSNANATNADDEINFGRYPAHLLPAEALYDAVAQVLEVNAAIAGEPKDRRAVQLAGAKTGGRFLKVFGKPDRLLTCECERFASTSLAQAFQMINGPDVRRMLVEKDNRIARMLKSNATDSAIVEELYLAAFCRPPTNTERTGLTAYVARSKDRRRALEDVVWGIINAREFLLQH